MKKRNAIISLMLSSLALIGLVNNKQIEVKAASNGYHVEEVVEDKFNKESLDDSWSLSDASVELNYNAIHCISPVSYGSGPIFNRFTLSDRTNIKFTIYPNSGEGASNISFNIGMPSATGEQKEPDVDARVQFWDGQLVFLDYQHNLAVDQSKINEHVLRGFSGLYSDLLRTDISLYIERKSPILTHIYAEYSRDGKIVYTNESTPFELNVPRYPNGYCGFFWDCVEMDVTNFEVYNNDQLVFADKLDENTLTYPSTDKDLGNFHVNNVLNETNVYVSRVSSVLMAKQNASIVNSYELTKTSDITTPYSFEYNVKLNELNDNSFCGFGFGLAEGEKNVGAQNAIGFIKNDDLTAEVVAIKNGQIDRSNRYQIALAKLQLGKYQTYKIELDYANNAYLTIGGQTYKFSNINYYGRFGLGLVDCGASKASNFELKQVAVYKNVYNKYSTEDASNDFKGRKEPTGNESWDTPYINDQKYYLGTGVSLEEDWATGKTTLEFNQATPYSSFGYRKQYSEWVLEFDLEVYTHNQGNMIGVSFGRKSIVDVLMQASQTNSAFILRCDVAENGNTWTGQTVYGAGNTFDNGLDSKDTTLNVFDLENTRYHLMFVARNRCVYVYYKAEDADDSELATPRAIIPNVNIDGYVSIVGNNYASFGVENFKIVNLSDECKEDSSLTLRESFENTNSVSERLVLDPTTKVEDGKLVMLNSSVSTATSHLYEIIRFTAEELETNLQIDFSSNKNVIFDVAKNQIVINEDGQKTAYDCNDINLAYVKGKRFEINIFGDQLTISYKGYYDPQDKLAEPLITHKLATPLSKDVISFQANGKASLDDLYIFALDNSTKASTYNYEDDPNNAVVWEVKKDYDPKKVYKYFSLTDYATNLIEKVTSQEGCQSSVAAGSMVLVLLGLVPVLVSRKRKEDK